ncbi:MAG: tetratricopeptide repeat protein [Candidatus Eremiobacteraeota bacterium]|nr:tetratricopeptide repeat protein [Candidatus Eremiobacteraeota bacterium]MBC5828113.1 tetratricopeptide repeat protein [Candidatus Eremiobacteraeota bacterium]
MPERSPYLLGLAAFERGDYLDAMRRFTQAVAVGDQPAAALSKRGVCRVRIDDLAAAEADFSAALERDARCTAAIVNLGNLALCEGRLDEAQARYRAAIRIDENHASAHHNLGVVYRRLGRLGESVRELRLAARLESDAGALAKRLKFWK